MITGIVDQYFDKDEQVWVVEIGISSPFEEPYTKSVKFKSAIGMLNYIKFVELILKSMQR